MLYFSSTVSVHGMTAITAMLQSVQDWINTSWHLPRVNSQRRTSSIHLRSLRAPLNSSENFYTS